MSSAGRRDLRSVAAESAKIPLPPEHCDRQSSTGRRPRPNGATRPRPLNPDRVGKLG